MYMPAGASMVAPMPYETVAAPVAAYAPQLVETSAFLQVPEVLVQSSPGFSMPAPVKLTEGLMSPEKLAAEREAYDKALDGQLKTQSDAIQQEVIIKKKMLEQQTNAQKAQFALQTDEQLRISSLQIDQQAQQQIMGIQEAAITQRTRKEEEIAIATADYAKRKAMEDFAQKAYAVQKKYADLEVQKMAEYNKVMKAGSKAVVTPQMMMVAP